MISYNEKELLARLSRLPLERRVAFATACATRLKPAYASFAAKYSPGGSAVVDSAVGHLWDGILSGSLSDPVLEADLEQVMSAIPGEDEDWTPLHSFADDAASSTAYAIRTYLSKDPQEAVWASRRCYDAVDLAAQQDPANISATTFDEKRLLAHPLVQQELNRQRLDLEQLERVSDTKAVAAALKAQSVASPAVPT